ncbi:hypothetical protein [Paracoccus sp. TOH]|uniref:hypothetical protein n=1 Tax=Paracoccus sp. TOH TaxID=1263728 RepID=UPI0025AF9A15|nr:hypothetical protein [Paracoccus sp. TOH]WJS84230.1 hypothetical protein NBE95_00105 [Paracoccus sp. TOH]
MIDSDLGILALGSGILASLAVSIAHCFHGDLRLKVLAWMAGFLGLTCAGFLGCWHIGFSRPAGDAWEAACFLVAGLFGLTAVLVLILFIILNLKEI